MKDVARVRAVVAGALGAVGLIGAGCGLAGRSGEAADTSTPPLATVPPPTTMPLPAGGGGGAAPSSDPCDWVDDDVLDELFEGRPPEATSSSTITHRQCDWAGSLGSTSLSVRVDSGSVYDDLARDPSVPSLPGTALPSLVEALPGDAGRRVSVRLVDGTLQVTLERYGVVDEDLLPLVDEIVVASGN